MSFAKSAPPPPPPKQRDVTALTNEEKQELRNIKQLCLTVIKAQKRLVREVGKVKESLEHSSISWDSETTPPPVVITPDKPQVTIQDVHELEEAQKKNLKSHLIALDMKEQGTLLVIQILRSCCSLQTD